MARSCLRSVTRLLGLAAACLIPAPVASAGPLTTGNLIVTVDDFTGFTYPPVYLAEYNTSGTRIQTISTIPAPPNDNGSQEARGTVLSPDGKTIYVFNASADQQPYLAAYNVAGNSWTQQTNATWGARAAPSTAASASMGPTFSPPTTIRPTAASCGSTPRLRRSTTSARCRSRTSSTCPSPAQGRCFALDGQSNVYEYNASTLALEHTFAIKFQQNEVVAGMSDGEFYVATAQGEIDHYSATGTLLKSITVTNNLLNGITTPDFFDSIAINEATGQIALGTANHGQVVLTDLALDTPTAFVATDPTTNFDSGNVHVAWVTATAVPEPSTLSLLGIAVSLLAAHPRFRAAGPRAASQ